MYLYITPAPYDKQNPKQIGALDEATLAALVSCLTSGSNWLFRLSLGWLSKATGEEPRNAMWEAMPGLHTSQRRLLARWLGLSEPDPISLTTSWLGGDDDALREAGAFILGVVADEHDRPAVISVAGDTDLTVRRALQDGISKNASLDTDAFITDLEEALTTPHSRWSCTSCGSRQKPQLRRCGDCSTGKAPDLAKKSLLSREDIIDDCD